MKINIVENESDGELGQIGIDISFLTMLSSLGAEKQHGILLSRLKGVECVLHPGHNPDLTAAEIEQVTRSLSRRNGLKKFKTCEKQPRISRSDKNRVVSSLNAANREKKMFAGRRRFLTQEINSLGKATNDLTDEEKFSRKFCGY